MCINKILRSDFLKKTLTSTLNKKKSKRTEFKFSVGEEIMYVGKLFDQYEKEKGEILSRNSSKGKIYYKVKFEDGKVLEFMEAILKRESEVDCDV
jgi:hypothetical protein